MGTYLEALKKLKEELLVLLGDGLAGMFLFGSRARGDYQEDSDIDVAILVRGMSPQLKEKILEKVAEFELAHDIVVSALVISEKDFNQLKRRERRIALDIEQEGIPL